MGRRQQVSLRVKVRDRRRRIVARFFLLLALFGGGWIALKASDLPGRLRRWAGPLLVVESVDASRVPEPARAEVQRAMDPWAGRSVGLLEVGRQEKALRAKLGYLDGLKLERSFSTRIVTASAGLKAPVARVIGGSIRWLGADGEIFDAPPGLYTGTLFELKAPKTDVDLKPFVAFLGELGPKLGIVRGEYEGPEEGWTFWDGTGLKLKWGQLSKGPEKLQRLSQVLDDAKGRFGGVGTADLRFFEDGRVLVEPRAAAGRPGR